jgi:hypothetical protein
VAERARDLIRQICQARDVVFVVAGSHPPAVVGPAGSVTGQDGAIHQGTLQPASAGGVSGIAKTLLGTAHVGAVDEATIKAYVESQKRDEDDQGFKITAPAEP